MSNINEKFQLGMGTDRLIFLTVFFILFLHISGCMYVVLSDFEDSRNLYYSKFQPL